VALVTVIAWSPTPAATDSVVFGFVATAGEPVVAVSAVDVSSASAS